MSAKNELGEYLAKLQARAWLSPALYTRLANTLLEDEESARDNHVLVCNFAKYSPILITWLNGGNKNFR